MQPWVARGVHQLDGEIHAPGRRIGLRGRHDVLFAQDGRVALDHKPGALLAVRDEAIAQNETLAAFQLDLETHCMPFCAAPCWT